MATQGVGLNTGTGKLISQTLFQQLNTVSTLEMLLGSGGMITAFWIIHLYVTEVRWGVMVLGVEGVNKCEFPDSTLRLSPFSLQL